MRRKIAVIADGWNNLSITKALKGIRSCTDKLNIDVYLFLSYAAFAQSQERNDGENAIFDLPDYHNFDGVLLFAAMLNDDKVAQTIAEKFRREKIICVCVGTKIDGFDYVGIENFQGMYEMVAHLVDHHHIKNPVFLAGPKTHPDSNARLQAAKMALMDRNVNLPDENISYTNWEYETSIKCAQKYSKQENPPDAYICANDYIAIAACIGLERNGVKVPDDAVVTGFDRISSAETFYPSITTVYQNYENIGYMAAWQLMERIEGTAKVDSIQVSSEYVLNESCGCKKSTEAEIIRHKFCRDSYSKEMENMIFQTHSSDLAQVLFSSKSVNDFKVRLSQLFLLDHAYEGDYFWIVIDDNAFKSFNDSSFHLKNKYSQKMHCIIAIENGKIKKYDEFNKTDIIPSDVTKVPPMLYTITSLHFDDNLFGYIVIGNAEQHINDSTLNTYMLQMNSNLEKYRQTCQFAEMNKALREISVRDQLSTLYNRFGLEQIAYPMFEKIKKENKSCAIIFTDINRMKNINDNFGHLNGDLAIKTVASAILQNLPPEWIIVRYGGDEFVAVGECKNEKTIIKYEKEITDYLAKQVESMHLAFPLTASVGHIIAKPKDELTLKDYINQADSVMYIHKQKTYNDEQDKSMVIELPENTEKI